MEEGVHCEMKRKRRGNARYPSLPPSLYFPPSRLLPASNSFWLVYFLITNSHSHGYRSPQSPPPPSIVFEADCSVVYVRSQEWRESWERERGKEDTLAPSIGEDRSQLGTTPFTVVFPLFSTPFADLGRPFLPFGSTVWCKWWPRHDSHTLSASLTPPSTLSLSRTLSSASPFLLSLSPSSWLSIRGSSCWHGRLICCPLFPSSSSLISHH